MKDKACLEAAENGEVEMNQPISKVNDMACDDCREKIEAIKDIVRGVLDVDHIEDELAAYNHKKTGSWDVTAKEFSDAVGSYIDDEIDELESFKTTFLDEMFDLDGEVINAI
jgi:hypothetical protein